MRNQVENLLEAERGKKIIKAVLQIQKTFKMHLARVRFIASKSAVVQLQKAGRGFIARKNYRQNYKRVIVIQSGIFSFLFFFL